MSDTWGQAPDMLAAAGGDADAAADALLDRLTRDEIVSMLGGQRRLGEELFDGVRGRYNAVPYPAAAIERLGFPGIRFTDGPRGVVVGNSTAFPISMARGATFDPDLEREIGDAIGAEATAQGANLFAGICINLLRHPAWGRAQETYGEDTLLLGEMGAALTESVGRHMGTCVKHFAVNSMENSRFFVDVRIDEADLNDIYLPHFKRCVDAGVDSVMSAYNKVNGEWAGHHHELLTTVLKKRWGFQGFVMSDFGLGIRDMVAALDGGQDLEMPMTLRARKVPAALAEGRLEFARVRDAARRLAVSVFRAAGRSRAEVPPRSVVASSDHRALSKRAAGESFVLLRNETVAGGPALPLAPTDGQPGPRTMALIGGLAAQPNTGDRGSSNVRSTQVTTVADGMRSAAGAHGVTLSESLSDDVALAATVTEGADAAVVVVGSTWRDEGEFIGPVGGDRKSLTLSGRHEALIEEVAARCPPHGRGPRRRECLHHRTMETPGSRHPHDLVLGRRWWTRRRRGTDGGRVTRRPPPVHLAGQRTSAPAIPTVDPEHHLRPAPRVPAVPRHRSAPGFLVRRGTVLLPDRMGSTEIELRRRG